MAFQEILELCKAKAISDLLSPSEDSVYRSICRTYSKTFHTELEKVYAMDPEKVVSAVFEDKYDQVDRIEHLETLLEEIYTLEDPDYRKQQQAEMEPFIKMAEKLEKARMQKTEKTPFSRDVPKEESKPTGGSVDFSGLNEKKEG